jgi:hypothetical protein
MDMDNNAFLLFFLVFFLVPSAAQAMGSLAQIEKKSCRYFVKKCMMQEENRCPSCFEIDQRDSEFWIRKTGGYHSSIGICHLLYPELAERWKAYDADASYWEDGAYASNDGEAGKKVYLMLLYSSTIWPYIICSFRRQQQV